MDVLLLLGSIGFPQPYKLKSVAEPSKRGPWIAVGRMDKSSAGKTESLKVIQPGPATLIVRQTRYPEATIPQLVQG
jgi:hypothetical protein